MSWELRALPLQKNVSVEGGEDASHALLPPVPQLAQATAIDYYAGMN